MVDRPARVTFKLHRYPASEWVRKNPILQDGEPGVEKNTGRIKVGDGVTRWTLLPYSVSDALLRRLVEDALNNVGELPDPTNPEDDGISFVLLYENAKV